MLHLYEKWFYKNSMLEVVPCYTYLGAYFTSKLCWANMTDVLCKYVYLCHVYIVILYATCIQLYCMSCVYSYIVCHVYIVILYVTCTQLYCMSRVYSYIVCHVYIVILYVRCIQLYCMSHLYSYIVCFVWQRMLCTILHK